MELLTCFLIFVTGPGLSVTWEESNLSIQCEELCHLGQGRYNILGQTGLAVYFTQLSWFGLNILLRGPDVKTIFFKKQWYKNDNNSPQRHSSLESVFFCREATMAPSTVAFITCL